MTSTRSSITVRPLGAPEEFRAGVGLYRAVLGLEATDPAVSPRLLASLGRNGGSAIGAFAGDGRELVGFAYGFVGRDPATGETYHYSQTAVVATRWQGRGVGRELKLGQRAYVLDTGLTRMRWSYDPVRAGNAHFNLDVLGARGRWFVRDFYGVDDMGRDRGHHSDRLIVDWDLAGPPVPAPVPAGASDPAGRVDASLGWGQTVRRGNDLLVGVPRHWSEVAADPVRAGEVRAAVSDAIEPPLADGFVACSCRVADRPGSGGSGDSGDSRGSGDSGYSGDTAVYVLRKEAP